MPSFATIMKVKKEKCTKIRDFNRIGIANCGIRPKD